MGKCKLFVIEGDAKNKNDAIRLTAAVLDKEGCVNEGFYESCIDREKEYPTGLTDTCPVAIPHTTKEYVKEDAICVLKLKEPVMFNSMENIDTEIKVKTVFNLAFLDDNEHIVLISKIIRSLKKTDFIEKLEKLPIDELREYLKSVIIDEQ